MFQNFRPYVTNSNPQTIFVQNQWLNALTQLGHLAPDDLSSIRQVITIFGKNARIIFPIDICSFHLLILL